MKKKFLAAYNLVTKFQFIRYLIVGGISTLIDWSVFYTGTYILSIHYQISLVIAFFLGCTANYTLNKIFTFKCKSKKIAKQTSVYGAAAIISLLLSASIMFVLVSALTIDKLVSRIATTFIMVGINYLLNKHIIFNKRFFN